jgi:hypothetical protein
MLYVVLFDLVVCSREREDYLLRSQDSAQITNPLSTTLMPLQVIATTWTEILWLFLLFYSRGRRCTIGSCVGFIDFVERKRNLRGARLSPHSCALRNSDSFFAFESCRERSFICPKKVLDITFRTPDYFYIRLFYHSTSYYYY